MFTRCILSTARVRSRASRVRSAVFRASSAFSSSDSFGDALNQFAPKLVVLGVGGAGGNAVNHMIKMRLEGVRFAVANTDAQALSQSLASTRIQLSPVLTGGLGAGANPEIGKAAVEGDSLETILETVKEAHLVFLAAGMGGGTGTGASPVIASALRERGILTVGVVTQPFRFEGQKRNRVALAGLNELSQHVDCTIVIPNQKLLSLASQAQRMSLLDGFRMADDVLLQGVQTVADLIVKPSLINVDFGDVRTVLLAGNEGLEENEKRGDAIRALMGTGEAAGAGRAAAASQQAVEHPLMNDVSLDGARGILINIAGGADLTMEEVEEAASWVQERADEDAHIVWGATQDDALTGRVKVSVVATGLSGRID